MQRFTNFMALAAAVLAVSGLVQPAAASDVNSDGGNVVSPGAPVGTGADAGPWATVTACPVGVSRPAGAFVNGHFLIVGGESTGGARCGYVQEYDPGTDNWDNTNATMPTGVSNNCAAAIGNALNTGRRTFAAAQDQVNGYFYAGAGWAGAYLTNAERSSYVVPVELMSFSVE